MTGRFEMGSTIALIFEASKDTQLNVHEGKRVLLGDKIVCKNSQINWKHNEQMHIYDVSKVKFWKLN